MLLEIFSRFIAICMLFALSPVFILIILCCLLFQGLPIFFTQTRVGYNFKRFKIYKFRSMINNNGNVITEATDQRVTKLGRFLRYTKADELPQLINIVKGEMRFIGPRPEVEDFFDEESFKFLKIVKPGISDFASIVLRNESKILVNIGGKNSYEKLLPVKLELANYYAEKKSFFLDLQLVIITIVSIFYPNFAVKKMALTKINFSSKKANDFFGDFIIKYL